MPSNMACARRARSSSAGLSLAERLHEVVADGGVGDFVGPVVVVDVFHEIVADAFAENRGALEEVEGGSFEGDVGDGEADERIAHDVAGLAGVGGAGGGGDGVRGFVGRAAGECVRVLADVAAVGFEQAHAELGVADFVPRLAGHGHDELPRHGPLLPLADLTGEGVDAGELGADDAADEGLAELDVRRVLGDHLAKQADLVVGGRAELLLEASAFIGVDEHGGAIRGIALGWKSTDLFSERLGHSETPAGYLCGV